MSKEIIDWLDACRTRYKGTLTLSLRNHRDDGRNDQIDFWELPELVDAGGLWRQIEATAQSDADLLGGSHRYVVVCLSGKEHLARRLFVVEGRAEAGAVGNHSAESALLMMLMRSLHDKDRFLMQTMQATVTPLRQELERVTARCEKLETRDDERSVAFEHARSEQHNRELASFLAKHQAEMSQEVVHGLRMLVPWAVNQVDGKASLPTTGLQPHEQSLQALLESIRPDQLDKLKEVFTPHQAVALMKLHQLYTALPQKKG